MLGKGVGLATVVVELLLVLVAAVLASQKGLIGSWIGVCVPLYIQDLSLAILFVLYVRQRPRPPWKDGLVRIVALAAKIAVDVVLPLHADGHISGPTTAILAPVYLLTIAVFVTTLMAMLRSNR
ncbi:hypothetical protein PTSG_11706 [Salpingoeca rosetta]|uniref:Uncharacterized protein n=1 Tax=Salpingoeca rosetta (strain ATCC 50818 / BSB-021) TaxID=946362 RepID=F2TZZ2_SALR5|nr:uncharacterized protein PTSG_11706 [Salpingoeca rosetta]EGD80720.1 hypothetical protein PTSG_11706 [Salpingoeca rosetta]|eukprot:XP_004997281.1 hypothetical protein PTSG_11706 [Salpingoeca rosetta]